MEPDLAKWSWGDFGKRLASVPPLNLIIWGLLAFAAIGYLPHLATCCLSAELLQKAGTFGDSFGFANSIVNAIGLIALLVTLNLQRRSLSLQQDSIQEATRLTALTAEVTIIAAQTNVAAENLRELRAQMHSHEDKRLIVPTLDMVKSEYDRIRNVEDSLVACLNSRLAYLNQLLEALGVPPAPPFSVLSDDNSSSTPKL
jgi:hypothetical protein